MLYLTGEMTNAVLRTASCSVAEVDAANRGGVDVIIGNLQHFESEPPSRNSGPRGCGERVAS